ncbi:MAG: hypothetical protein JW719_06330, partial [Pirellulales bacterium]|nr:hypothetical protein [Pirellulales bacterium]
SREREGRATKRPGPPRQHTRKPARAKSKRPTSEQTDPGIETTEAKDAKSTASAPKDAMAKTSERRNSRGKRIRLGSKKERRRNRRRS